jgi:hypothetical protein
MSDRKAQGLQLDTIPRFAPQIQESFDLKRLESFVTGLGVDFLHYRAMPSPIGKNDRGSLRRNDGVDTITSNGMIYRLAGQFTAVMTDNSREQRRGASGMLDPSESRLVMPRFYNKQGIQNCGSDGVAEGERIYLAPGDRIYIADPNADVLVSVAQQMDYQEDIDNEALYPIVRLQEKILDSRNIQYTQGVDFELTPEGNIRWMSGGNNPGIDPETGKGRIYAIVYLYRAFYYVTALPKEVRVTNVTVGSERIPTRMPYHAIIVREFIFHNKSRGDQTNTTAAKPQPRADAAPQQSIGPNEFTINVDMTTVAKDED